MTFFSAESWILSRP